MTKLVFLLFLVLISLNSSFGADSRPSVIILLADDLGYGDVGFNGSDIATPNLDRIADQGVQLESFYACPMCTPTRAGLMTGRYPLRFGLMRSVIPPQRDYGLDPSEETLAEVFEQGGYNHRGVVGKWHLGHRRIQWFPTEQGFTYFVGCLNGAIDYFTHERNGELDWHHNLEPSEEEGYSTDLIGEAAVDFIKRVPADEPYFLYVPFNAPHSPFQANESDLEKYPHRKGNRRIYAAMVDSMDQAVGKIIGSAQARDDWENTLVLFFSDNGGVGSVASNGEMRGNKLTQFQGGVRVAAAAYWKAGGIVGGKRIRERMGYIDVLPTIRKVIGLESSPLKPLDGIDVLDAMRGKSELKDRPWFTYMDQNDDRMERLAVNRDKWKLVITRPAPDSEKTESNVELFEIRRDPNEKNDVSRRNPEVVEALAAELDGFLKMKSNRQIIRFRAGAQTTPAIPNWTPSE
ncbi:MAG: arylsulfatase [Opitutales bacterium]